VWGCALCPPGHNRVQWRAHSITKCGHLRIAYFDVVRFQVLTVASMKMIVFWDAVPCSLIKPDRHFGGAYCLHHQGDSRLYFDVVQQSGNQASLPSFFSKRVAIQDSFWEPVTFHSVEVMNSTSTVLQRLKFVFF
jgi:hypothetical protein